MKRILSVVLVLCLILSFGPTVSADSQLQHNYSQTYNSGIRHETCTTLLGTRVDAYYTGEYTYENLSQLSGSTLLYTLRELMTDTHDYYSTYTDCKNYIVKTDCENGDGKSVNLIYTSYSSSNSERWDNLNNGWNREHVWPKSLGGFDTTRAGSDLHHIRPSDANVNSARSNSKYGYVTNGYTIYGNITGSLIGGTSDGPTWQTSNTFEPVDNVKGDVARIILYMYARWGGEYSKCSNVTNVFQSVDVLLEWCALDPVDTWEMGRNEVVAAIQGNRNVFIDYPELAWLIFDREIPEYLTSPTNGLRIDPAACTHSDTVLYAQKDATCTEEGYTGDTYCILCNKLLSEGSTVSSLGHQEELVNFKEATCIETGYTGDVKCTRCGKKFETGKEINKTSHTETVKNAEAATCCSKGYTGDTYCSVCNTKLKDGKNIAATGQHDWGEWQVYKQPTSTQPGYERRYCTNPDCDESQKKEIPALGSTDTPPVTTTPDPDQDRNNESDGDRNSVASGSDPDDNRSNESDGDRSHASQGSSSTGSTTPSTTGPTQQTEPSEVTEPTAESTAAATDVPETTAPTESSAPVSATEPSESTSPSGSTSEINTEAPDNSDSNSSNSVWIVICIIVLAACAAGIIVYFAAGRGKPKPTPTDPTDDPDPINELEDPDLSEDPLIIIEPIDD